MDVTNLVRYRNDLEKLLDEADGVRQSLQRQALGDTEFFLRLVEALAHDEKEAKALMKKIKPFPSAYQHWYSEALPLVKQLLPDRLQDFVRLYEKPKTRKDISYENYKLEDACQGLRVTAPSGRVVADTSSAGSLLEQQVAIVEAIKRRFESSLFEIKQTVQADLFDSELDSAQHLLDAGFSRAAGVISGVVLEGHLKEIRDRHDLGSNLKTIAPIIDKMKSEGIIELPQHRHLQYLGDIRNKCSHKNGTDPTADEVSELIAGTTKVIKTIF
ncbi:hypothetical protein [Pseudomonas sp. NPDC089401]|uniref:hypothetical protein n=1 Tax=Pseudomonas sp. NPDC089401 TaxID=3364462 RepID=UPI00380D4929